MENKKIECEDLIVKCNGYTHIIEICDFSSQNDTESDSHKTICLSFYHAIGHTKFFKSLCERIRGACCYLFYGKAGSVDVVLNQKQAENLVEKINLILNKNND